MNNPQLFFGDKSPKQMKETSETKKAGFALSRKVYTPSSTVTVNPKNQNKSQPFVWGDQGDPGERPATHNINSIHTKEN